jgi:hypothetical protein
MYVIAAPPQRRVVSPPLVGQERCPCCCRTCRRWPAVFAAYRTLAGQRLMSVGRFLLLDVPESAAVCATPQIRIATLFKGAPSKDSRLLPVVGPFPPRRHLSRATGRCLTILRSRERASSLNSANSTPRRHRSP